MCRWSLPEIKGCMEDVGSRLVNVWIRQMPDTKEMTSACLRFVVSLLVVIESLKTMPRGDKKDQELVRKLNQPRRIPDQVASLVDLDGVTLVIFGVLVGETLFKTHDNLEHLALMERILRSIPSHMLKRVGGCGIQEIIKAVSKLPHLPVQDLHNAQLLLTAEMSEKLEKTRAEIPISSVPKKTLELDKEHTMKGVQAAESFFFSFEFVVKFIN
ncbi:hypothetical protein C5167_006626 [Papaver somniferum]|uniref:Uncharacterized protein n=1 Tax=Papaver somniferum TaxID=3469 RepID=A0A4Y7JFM2_PAPSO|nr:hypothetical protein C5167_006626 [Papaver somniferum]